MSPFFLYFSLEENIFKFFIVYARVSVLFFLLPVFGSRILSNIIVKNVVITLAIIGLWPIINFSLIDKQHKILILCNEVVIGLVLALITCIPFWIVSSVGELIDNQRGATISDSIDPLHGIQSSILSGFLTFFYAALFFCLGGGKLVITILSDSYNLLPVGAGINKINFTGAGLILDNLVKVSIILASPVMIIMMLSEILLGVLSKYCPQLNPFSLSLTIKSILAFCIFIFYGLFSITQKHFNVTTFEYIRYFLS
ncbi:TPA: type III secretion system export apparatus subunit SctT [Salmonella enterica subsp. enterica serovar Frintrop]|nr:EscT/YscT/HrcT family type III secretion system export apparatus protein [Salmonella enterica subsp. enterica serovar Javiana]EED2931464.1 EscT/YscT/HrcT family type III secretion system export apparatus protein [Salmonella enterica subsp. enterica serovar Javiana]